MSRTVLTLLALIAVFGAPFGARAQDGSGVVEIASTLNADAKRLSAMLAPTPGARPLDLGTDTAFGVVVAEFARVTASASNRLRRSDGPADLACIYAGMADDAERQAVNLASARSAGEQARILAAISALAADAEMIAPDVQHETAAAPSGTTAVSCPASAPVAPYTP